MSITGEPGRGPMRVGIPIADLSGRPLLRARASWWRCSSASSRARARRSRPRCCRRRSSCSISRARAGSTPRRCRARPATTIRPASRPASSRPATATSTSPRPGGDRGSGCAAPSAPRRCIEDPDYATARRARQEPRCAQCRDRALPRRPHQRRMGRAPQRGRGAVRADLRHRPDVRRSAGRALDMVQDVETPDERGTLHLVGQPVTLGAHAEPARRPAARARRAQRRGVARVRLLAMPRSPTCARPR